MTQNALTEAALEAGTDPKILRNIMKGNKKQGTTLEIDGATRLVKPSKGVSHLLPNPLQPCDEQGAEDTAPVDWKPEGTEKLNHLAFADEVVLLSKKQTGLQNSINTGDRA